jgi:hypothetical protein
MAVQIKTTKNVVGYLYHGTPIIGDFVVIETIHGYAFGIVAAIEHHYFTGRDTDLHTGA